MAQQNEGIVAIQITDADVAAVTNADPLVAAHANLMAEKLKVSSLTRLAAELQAKVAELEAAIAKSNGKSSQKVPREKAK